MARAVSEPASPSPSPSEMELLDEADFHRESTGSSRQSSLPYKRQALVNDARDLPGMPRTSDQQYEPIGSHPQLKKSFSLFRICSLMDRETMVVMMILGIASIAIIGVLSTVVVTMKKPPIEVKSVRTHWRKFDDYLGMAGYQDDDYPTDITRDIQPIPCHSHNDYWRKAPLVEAIHYGCIGVEADVWLRNNDLLVGHNTVSLTKKRTFRNLYVDPLVNLLDKQNPRTNLLPSAGSASTSSRAKLGVFDTNPLQTLILLVDFKTDPAALWPVVIEQLEPLRSKGYLSHFDGTDFVPGPVTVVGTGNLPFQTILDSDLAGRHVFIDAPLDALSGGGSDGRDGPESSRRRRRTSAQRRAGPASPLPANEHGPSRYNTSNAYYASTDFDRVVGRVVNGRLTDDQTSLIRSQVQAATELGLQSRYWGTPQWPIKTRNHVWRVLYESGAHILNVDDLRAAALNDW